MEKRQLTVSNHVMTSLPIDKPMARALGHLASGRIAQAIGAFRAVLAIDSSAVPARLGLADAMSARGHHREAVAGLLEAAELYAQSERHTHALSLYAKALALDPRRIELHLDVAVVEQAMGHHDAAVARVEGLAERYMSEGRTDEAAELLRFAATWEETFEEIEPELEPQASSTETVVCATVLVRPDGTFWFGNGSSPAAPMAEAMPRTVARAVSAPIVLDDMQTRVAPSPAMRARAAAKPASARPPRSPNALVERLRMRAGLDADAGGVPRRTKVRGTEPIAVRRFERAEREEVTHRFRRPRALERATAG